MERIVCLVVHISGSHIGLVVKTKNNNESIPHLAKAAKIKKPDQSTRIRSKTNLV